MTDTDNLELKKRSRRRLVGAAALALLAAVLLPMVMDQEPRRAVQDIQVVIPDREADSTLSRPIGNRAGAAGEVELAPPPEEEPAATSSTPKAATPAPSQTAASKEAQTNAPQLPPAPASRPAPATDEAARVQALLSGVQPDAAKTASREEAMVVQIGAFGEPGAAAALAGELKAKGFAAYTEKAGSVTRVRVGPFASRAEAEKAAERLRAAGRKAVVTPR